MIREFPGGTVAKGFGVVTPATWVTHCCGLGLTSGLRTSTCHRCGEGKKRERERESDQIYQKVELKSFLKKKKIGSWVSEMYSRECESQKVERCSSNLTFCVLSLSSLNRCLWSKEKVGPVQGSGEERMEQHPCEMRLEAGVLGHEKEEDA